MSRFGSTKTPQEKKEGFEPVSEGADSVSLSEADLLTSALEKPNARQPLLPFTDLDASPVADDDDSPQSEGDQNEIQDDSFGTATRTSGVVRSAWEEQHVAFDFGPLFRGAQNQSRSVKSQLLQAKLGSNESQISSEALEIALKELQDRLPTGNNSDESEPLSLAEAMAFIRAHTPPK